MSRAWAKAWALFFGVFMDPITGALILGGIGLGGSIFGSATNYQSQQETNAMQMQLAQNAQNFSAQQAQNAMSFADYQAQRQMGFQNYMSSTAHQREVADLKKAGINPAATMGGSGAAMAGGSAAGASMGQAQQANLIAPSVDTDVVQRGVSTAAQAASTLSDIQKKREEMEQIRAATDRAHAEVENVRADTRIKDTEAVNRQALLSTQLAQAGVTMRGGTAKAKLDEIEAHSLAARRSQELFSEAERTGKLAYERRQARARAMSEEMVLPVTSAKARYETRQTNLDEKLLELDAVLNRIGLNIKGVRLGR